MKSNPLATRFVAPGKLPWQPQRGQSLSQIYTRFTQELHYRAAIVGAHGSGKSTLLEHLVPMIGRLRLRRSTYGSQTEPEASESEVATRRSVVWLQMRGRTPSRKLLLETRATWARRECVLVIDGYEQLSRVSRTLAFSLSRLSGAGLLVTTHRPMWLPTLIETHVDVALARELLNQLLPPDDVHREQFLDEHRLSGLLDKHHGNLRELFMELYDEVEN